MKSIFKDTVFTNVALTEDGGVWWEGMTKKIPGLQKVFFPVGKKNISLKLISLKIL